LTVRCETTIRDHLIPALKATFGGSDRQIDPENNPIARFPGVQKEVGDVLIYDDGDEATVCVETSHMGIFAFTMRRSLKNSERSS